MKYKNIVAYFVIFLFLLFFPACSMLSKTELIKSVSNGDITRAQVLIERGANINETDKKGLTPLMWAICEKQTQAALKLIDMGADINIKDQYSFSALFYAISYGNMEVFNHLLAKGADLKQKDSNGYSYLHVAVGYRQAEIAKMLINMKLNVNEKNIYGETPLHLALTNRMYGMAKLLIDNGADINARDNYGSTPLHYTVRYGYTTNTAKIMKELTSNKDRNTEMTAKSMIDYLLSKNSDARIKDAWGFTPVSLAYYYKDEDLADFLKEKSHWTIEDDQEDALGNVDANLRYKLLKQTAGFTERIKAETEFRIRGIDYSAVNAKELGYATDEEWNVEKAGIPKTFTDACVKLLKEEGDTNKKIVMVGHDKNVADGIVVDIKVKRIILKWSFFDKKPDIYLCEIDFTDTRNGQKVFSGLVNITTLDEGKMSFYGGNSGVYGSSGGFTVGVSGPTFSIPVNPGMPGWEGTFSGRLHIAAYNMAWIIAKIMVNGEIPLSE